ncbi:hypothetical protein Tco_1046795 [Tanacetum coccineum]
MRDNNLLSVVLQYFLIIGVPEESIKQGRVLQIFDTDVESVGDVEMPVEAKVDGKMNSSTKTEIVQSYRENLKQLSPKLFTTAATTATQSTRPKDRRLLAERLQSKEREELTDEEKAKLFIELMEKRRKHFAALEHKKRETNLLPRHKRELKCLLILSTWENKEKKEKVKNRSRRGINKALWRIVKAKYGDTRPEDEFERVLYGDLRVMFEPDIKSDVWRMLQGYRIQKMNIKFRGGLLGLKRLHGFLEVTAAQKDYGKRIINPVWKNTRRVNDYYSTRMTHSNPRRNMIPQAVLMRSGIKAVNTAKPKDAHNVVKRNWFHDVKASACWVWRPKQKEILDNVSKHNSASMILKRLDYIDVQGRFKGIEWLGVPKEEITAAGEKVNAAKSLLVVSTEVKNRSRRGINKALWRIVKAKYGDTSPEDEFERVLYGDLRVMFEPDIIMM